MADFIFISNDIKLHDNAIEEMKSCLYAAEKHGIVIGQVIVDNKSLIKTAREYLPKYSVTEAVKADCFMVKQSLLDTFGKPGILSEYCARINTFGFSTIVAHHALYSHIGEGAGYGTQLENDPLLRFLPLIDEKYLDKKRILFDCILLPEMHGGTSEVMIASFEEFNRLFGDKYDIFFYTSREAAKYHRLTGKYGNIMYPDTINGIFHLGYVPNQLINYQQQQHLNERCLKITQQMLDIQMVRIYGHFPQDVRNNVKLSIKASDGIVFISNFSKDDFLAYYAGDARADEYAFESKKLRVIYPAKKMPSSADGNYDLPFDEFFLIAGSNFKHKAIKETIEAVAGTKQSYIAIGSDKEGLIHKNVFGYKSGQLDEALIGYLYGNCKAVIFPSLYEGFGLPVIMGMQNGKRLILYDNAINRELMEHFSASKEQFMFFTQFSQIGELAESIDTTAEYMQSAYEDNWGRAVTELETFFSEILAEETDISKFKKRWQMYKQIEAQPASAIDGKDGQYSEMSTLTSQFGDYKLLRLLRFAIKENIKHRHPKLYAKLKGKRT